MYEILYPADGRSNLSLNAGVIVRKYTTSENRRIFLYLFTGPY